MKTGLGYFFVLLSFFSCAFAATHVPADEGMYPVSEIARLDLKKHGLQMEAGDIFNPKKTCLIDGICKVNGCTGSFVSPSGLIVTNHHCAYRAIQAASTAETDYLKDGFQAKTLKDEILAKGYTVRITESFSDVSDEVLAALKPEMSFSERTKAIEQRQKEIEKKAESENTGQRAEVAEMFAGKTYVLFLYTYITDVRLVFAPPASVGNYGGDVDNWEWPRHTGDFTFMRAYTAPDGSTADYSADNVPYKPKRFIKVNPAGANEGDYVMLIGYPGRTARHKTASFLKYEQEVRLPYVVDLYNWQIDVMDAAGKEDRSVALKHSSRTKGLANVEKRSRGQLKGLIRKKIPEARAAAEADLQEYIDAEPERKKKYGSLLSDIAKVYGQMTTNAHEMDVQNFVSACRTLYIAFSIYDAAMERKKPDLEREAVFMDRNIDLTRRRLLLAQRNLHLPTDKVILDGMLARIESKSSSETGLDFGGDAKAWSDGLFERTKIGDAEFVQSCLSKSPDELVATGDPAFKWVSDTYSRYMQLREKGKAREGELDQLYGELITVKQEFLKTKFVPDANATLRLTFGHVKGYSPEDAVYKSPVTTLGGAIDKATGVDPFIMPERIVKLHSEKDFGQFAHPKLNDVPTAILYDTDTTGGNSGSPIIDAKGQLVGVNFDRAFEATINDFAWNESYSRSIGVDIRYALWITGKVFGATHLLEEMQVK